MTHNDVLTPAKQGTLFASGKNHSAETPQTPGVSAPLCGVLGFGAMRLPDVSETTQMVDAYLDGGFNYFDTAYVYGGSEAQLKQALTSRHRREDYLLADKLPPWSAGNPAACERIFNESLARCGVDYFDFYLVHSLDDANERKAVSGGAYAFVAAQKKKGTVKHIGFSFHGGAALLEHILTAHPEMEFVQLQLNYMDVLRGQAGELQKIALAHKKPIIVMEPIKGGTLASLPPAAEAVMQKHSPGLSPASWAMRYAAGLEGATVVLSGMSSLAQTKDNVNTFSPLKMLDAGETQVIEEVLVELSKTAVIPCTGCKYCLDSCPQGIEIPTCFALYNETKRGGEKWNRQSMYKLIPDGKRAGDCIGCGNCLPMCPQKIEIPDKLKDVTGMFG